jgi:hypothetical protein
LARGVNGIWLDGDVEGLEDAGGEALLLAEQAEEDVLCADVVVLEGPRLFLGKDYDLAGPLCESLEHPLPDLTWFLGEYRATCGRIPAWIPPGECAATGDPDHTLRQLLADRSALRFVVCAEAKV